MSAIEASVTTVLTSYTVALNRGALQGVGLGDRVSVWRSEEIIDPENGETLGVAKVRNIRLEVSEVHDRFCVAEVPREPGKLFTNLVVSVPRRRISTSSIGDSDTTVVRVGDAATIEIKEQPDPAE